MSQTNGFAASSWSVRQIPSNEVVHRVNSTKLSHTPPSICDKTAAD